MVRPTDENPHRPHRLEGGTTSKGKTLQEAVLLIDGKTHVVRLDTAERQALYQRQLAEILDEGLAQLRAGILTGDQGITAFTQGLSTVTALARVSFDLHETGNRTRPEEEGLPEAGQALCEAKQRHPAETYNVQADTDEVCTESTRTETLTTLRQTLDIFYAPVDDTLAATQRRLGETVRTAYSVLQSVLPTSGPLRQTLGPLIDWASGAARAAALTSKRNERLVRDTERRTLERLRDNTPQATPATGTTTPSTAVPAPSATPGADPFRLGRS